MIRSNSANSNASSSDGEDGVDNPTYFAPSASDHRLPSITEGEVASHSQKIPPRATSSTGSFPVIYEVSTDDNDPTKTGITFAPRQSASSESFHQPHNQSRAKSTALGPNERHLSILDPLSDRVSTILVWQNLSVQARESRYKDFRKRITSYKNYVPTRKYLLHNTSGAITGGLWAVMGMLSKSNSLLLLNLFFD